MTRLLRFLYTIYCIIPFAISFLIVIPCYFLIFNLASRKKAPRIAHALSRFWAAYLFFFFFIRIKIKNKELINPDLTYVFIANHRSVLDIPLYARSCKNTFRFLSKAELAKVPLMGYVIKRLYITVDRSDKSDRAKSLDKMKATLDEGISVFLAPEGTRNKTSAPLLDFREGAFRLAIKAKVPLAVLTIKNSQELLSPLHPLEMRPGTIYAEWSAPIDTSDFTDEHANALKEQAREIMFASLKDA